MPLREKKAPRVSVFGDGDHEVRSRDVSLSSSASRYSLNIFAGLDVNMYVPSKLMPLPK